MRLDPQQLEALCTQLCGALILPCHSQYDVSRIVSKQRLCLDTFSIHPCAVVTFHEPVPRMIEWLRKPVQESIGGS